MLSPSSSQSFKRARSGSIADLERPAKRRSPDTTGDTPPTSPGVTVAIVPANVEVIDLTEDTPPPTPLIKEQPSKPKTTKTPIPADAHIIDLAQDDDDDEEEYIRSILDEPYHYYYPTELGTEADGDGEGDGDDDGEDAGYSDEETDGETFDELDDEFNGDLDGDRERSFTYDAPETLNDGHCFDCHEQLTCGEGNGATTVVANNCKAVYCGNCVRGLNYVMCRKHPFPVQDYHKLLEMDCVVCWENKEDWELLDLPCGHPVCAPCCTTWANAKDDQDADAKGEPVDVDARGENYICGLCPGSKGVMVDTIIKQHGTLHHEEDRF